MGTNQYWSPSMMAIGSRRSAACARSPIQKGYADVDVKNKNARGPENGAFDRKAREQLQ
jgi:hypothetical protein